MRSRRRKEGLTVVEVALIVCVLGVCLAVFVPKFFGSVRTSKIAEAPELLAEMHRAADAYYTVDRPAIGRCLPPAAGPTPATIDGSFHEHAFADPDASGAATWTALGFAPDRTRYRYSFTPTFACAPEADAEVVYRAEGDLDGDGWLSSFERRDRVRGEHLQPVDVLRVVDEVE